MCECVRERISVCVPVNDLEIGEAEREIYSRCILLHFIEYKSTSLFNDKQNIDVEGNNSLFLKTIHILSPLNLVK